MKIPGFIISQEKTYVETYNKENENAIKVRIGKTNEIIMSLLLLFINFHEWEPKSLFLLSYVSYTHAYWKLRTKNFPCEMGFLYVYSIRFLSKEYAKDMTINYYLQLTCISMKYDPSQSITSENQFIVLIIFTSQELFYHSNKYPFWIKIYRWHT